jgi:hypothetical protein
VMSAEAAAARLAAAILARVVEIFIGAAFL